MAGRRKGGSPFKTLLEGIVTAFLIGIMLVILAVTPAWDAIVDATGIGRHVDVNSLFHKDPVRPDGSETILKPGQSGGQTDSTTTQPNRQPDKATTQPNNQTTTQPAGHDYWQAGLDATNAITTAKARQGGYDREQQFGGWASNGCGSATTRDTILERDMTDVKKNAKCQVVSGTLADPYTGRTIRFTRGPKTSAAVQIDHVVALQDAWASGARDWTQEKRVEYANSPDVLLASDGPANMAKGNGLDFNGTSRWLTQKTGAPDVWMPDNTAYRCDYMAKRAQIKAQWGLTMTAREKQQTVSVLASCVAGN